LFLSVFIAVLNFKYQQNPIDKLFYLARVF
jgi:hypothetical protein